MAKKKTKKKTESGTKTRGVRLRLDSFENIDKTDLNLSAFVQNALDEHFKSNKCACCGAITKKK